MLLLLTFALRTTDLERDPFLCIQVVVTTV